MPDRSTVILSAHRLQVSKREVGERSQWEKPEKEVSERKVGVYTSSVIHGIFVVLTSFNCAKRRAFVTRKVLLKLKLLCKVKSGSLGKIEAQIRSPPARRLAARCGSSEVQERQISANAAKISVCQRFQLAAAEISERSPGSSQTSSPKCRGEEERFSIAIYYSPMMVFGVSLETLQASICWGRLEIAVEALCVPVTWCDWRPGARRHSGYFESVSITRWSHNMRRQSYSCAPHTLYRQQQQPHTS